MANMTQHKLEQLIVKTLAQLGITGHVVATVDIYEDPAILRSTVATSNGQKHVYVDFHTLTDEDSVVREIKQQLTASAGEP